MTLTNPGDLTIPRHKAALKRSELSLPMAATIDAGILLPHHAHLDYGCGRGDDVRFLQVMGFRSRGYDPYYFPRTKKAADVVTLIYVLSTIEIPAVRCEALISAYRLTRQTLVVSAITPAIEESCGHCLQRRRNYAVGYVREVLLPHRTQTLDRRYFGRTCPVSRSQYLHCFP